MLDINKVYILFLNGDINSAKEALKRVSEKNDQYWYIKALISLKEGEYNSAKKFMDKAIKLKPQSAEYWFLKGKILALLDDNMLALKSFDKALTLNRNSDDIDISEILCEKVKCLIKLGKKKEAESIIEQLSEIGYECT